MSQKSDFLKLEQEWYDRLKDAGFEDIEKHGRDTLKSWASRFTQKDKIHNFFEREQYYYLANQFLTDHKFATRLDQIIWEYYANGLSVRDITVILAQARIAETNRTTVWQTVKRLERAMKSLYNVNAGKTK